MDMPVNNKTACVFPVGTVYLMTGLVFMVVGFLLSTTWNEHVFLFLNRSLYQVTGTTFWAVLTNFGDGFFLFPLAMLLVWRNPERQLALVFSACLAVFVLKLTKGLMAFDRPFAQLGQSVQMLIGPTLKHNSLPSGHTGTAFLFAGLALIWLRRKTALMILIMAVMVGLSRIAVGAHWPADILLGAWIGLVCALAGVRLSQSVRQVMPGRIIYLFLGLVAAIVLPNYDNGFCDVCGVMLCQHLLAAIALVVLVSEMLMICRSDDQYHSAAQRSAG